VISVLVLFRSARQLAANCLQSLRACLPALAEAGGAEFIFIDDHSDPAIGIVPLLEAFRAAAAPADVRIIRFRQQMHYAYGLAAGFSLARGDSVLFVSHDMMLTPDCVAAMLEAGRGDLQIGIVRPTSQHMDWAKSFAQSPPPGVTTIDSIFAFSAEIRRLFGNEIIDWPMLIGDAMLVSRSVIEAIGVFDTRYFGFMTDIDYGVRAHRAGFRHVIARGAWLHHEGNGAAKETAATGGASVPEQAREMLKLVEAAYVQFRRKWGGEHLPPTFREMRRSHFETLHHLSRLPAGQFQPPIALTPDIAEFLPPVPSPLEGEG
jgi:hypothetical protein